MLRRRDDPRARAALKPYLVIALLAGATVAVGFWPTYFGPLLTSGRVGRPWFVHVHAGVFLLWVALLVAQASLAASGKLALHRRLGNVGIAYGALVLCVGLAISVAAPAFRVRAGQMPLDRAGLVALYNLTDILAFGAFLALAVAYRRRRDVHTRLIVAATVALTGAAVGRVLPTGWIYVLVWLAPLIVSLGIDLATLRRPHGITIASAVVFAIVLFKVDLLSLSPIPAAFGMRLVAPFV